MDIISAIVAIGTVVGAIYGIFKIAEWNLKITPEQDKERIDESVDEEEKKVKKTGRPV